MGREIEKMIPVGLVWGATNALMRRAAVKWDQTLKSSPPPNTAQAPRFLSSLRHWLSLLFMWQYFVPFFLNLSASAAFFALLGHAPISLAVPVTNAITFASTAVFGMLLGEETRLWPALFGTLLIVLGVYTCVM